MEASVDIDFRQVPQLGNALLTQIDRLREHSPIFWSPTQNAWIVTGHSEVAEGFRGILPLSADRLTRVFTYIPEAQRRAHIPYLMKVLPYFLINLDPPEQTRLRKLMMNAFSRSVTESLRPYAREVIDRVLSRAAERRRVEFVEEVARQVPARIILKLMGLSEEYLPRLGPWARALTAGIGGGANSMPILDECEAALKEMREAFEREIAERRRKPTDDFISALILAEEDGERLTDLQIHATCYLTLIAGHDSTANTIVLGTAVLAENPTAVDFIREQPEEIANAVMEIMRYIAMATAMVRLVREDFEWNGHALKKGQLVYLMIAGANRDPAIFADPNRLDLTRSQAGNMTFAPGRHFCIGHMLAKMQIVEFFRELVRRFDQLEILDDRLDWSTSVGFRGLHSLNLALHPRQCGGRYAG